MSRLLFYLILILPVSIFAQQAPMKLGKVAIADLEMSYYPSDSTVDAAILCDFAQLDYTVGNFNHLRRIKIFTKEGLNHLIFRTSVQNKHSVKGYVINLVEGEVVKEKITKDHIMYEVSEGQTNIRIAPPNAREGSIVDVAFTYNGIPYFWAFQYNIPVRYSEFNFPMDNRLKVKFLQVGFEPVEVKSLGWYIARDLPAFVPEPYINSARNYMSGLRLDFNYVAAVAREGNDVNDPTGNRWRDISEAIWERGGYMHLKDYSYPFVDEIVDSIANVTENERERVSLAVQAIHKRVTWNGIEDLVPTGNIRSTWVEGEGTSADMNMLLIKMLTKMDLDVKPIASSSRSHGVINPFFPSISSFNTFLCLVTIDGDQMIVDASAKYARPGMLPLRSINGGGLVLDREGGKLFDYQPREAEQRMYNCNLKLDESGSMDGHLDIQHRDYGAMNLRKQYYEYGSQEDYITDIETELGGIYIEDYTNDIDSSLYDPVRESMNLTFDDYANSGSGLITLSPVAINRLNENPFKIEERLYPVDFGTKKSETIIVNIELPTGYEVEQLPESVFLSTEGGSVQFRYQIQQMGNKIQLYIKQDIRKPVFTTEEYSELKMIFSAIVAKEAERIILRKI